MAFKFKASYLRLLRSSTLTSSGELEVLFSLSHHDNLLIDLKQYYQSRWALLACASLVPLKGYPFQSFRSPKLECSLYLFVFVIRLDVIRGDRDFSITP